jgi:hypothetical protein
MSRNHPISFPTELMDFGTMELWYNININDEIEEEYVGIKKILITRRKDCLRSSSIELTIKLNFNIF